MTDDILYCLLCAAPVGYGCPHWVTKKVVVREKRDGDCSNIGCRSMATNAWSVKCVGCEWSNTYKWTGKEGRYTCGECSNTLIYKLSS